MPLSPGSTDSALLEFECRATLLNRDISFLLGEDNATRQYASLSWRHTHQRELLALKAQLQKLNEGSELSKRLNQQKITTFLDKLEERVEALLNDARFYDNLYDDCYKQFVFLVTNIEEGQEYLTSTQQREKKKILTDIFLLFQSVKARRSLDESSPHILLEAFDKLDSLQRDPSAIPKSHREQNYRHLLDHINKALAKLSELCVAFGEDEPALCYGMLSIASANEAFRLVKEFIGLDEQRLALEKKEAALIREAKELNKTLTSVMVFSSSVIRVNGKSYRFTAEQASILLQDIEPAYEDVRQQLQNLSKRGSIKQLVTALDYIKEQILQAGERWKQSRLARRRLSPAAQRRGKAIRSSLIVLDYDLRELREQRWLLDMFSVLDESLQCRTLELARQAETIIKDEIAIANALEGIEQSVIESRLMGIRERLQEVSTGVEQSLARYEQKLCPDDVAEQPQCEQRFRHMLVSPGERREAIEQLSANRDYFVILAVWCDMLNSPQFSAVNLPDCQSWVETVRSKFMALQLKCLKPYKKHNFINDTLTIIRQDFSEKMQQEISRRSNGGLLSFLRYKLILRIYIFLRAIGIFRRRSYTLFANAQEDSVRRLLHDTSNDLLNIQKERELQQPSFCNKKVNLFP